MESKSCEEFIVGFCPNEEFYVENVTLKCPHSHIKAERIEYLESKKNHPFEYKVLEHYKGIIDEVNKRIELNLKMLARETVDKRHRKALDECESLIELKNLSDFDFTKTHSLLLLHGRLVESIIKSRDSKNLDVCRVCSAFIEKKKPCSHQLCEKYRNLRKLTSILELKLPPKPRIE